MSGVVMLAVGLGIRALGATTAGPGAILAGFVLVVISQPSRTISS